ncbi:MAG: hypothetical protein H6767_01555 [Candidatus Peribacteria bacterium]|nr:MAG: hypothetical protein H6767_01555 [Candidatus Peribacteria bacterium]
MKNFLYLVLGLIYFFVYYQTKDDFLLNYYIGKWAYGKEIFSYMNAFVAIFLSVGIISLLNNKIHTTLTAIFEKTANKYDDLVGESIYVFIRTVKYILSFYI